MSNLAAAQSGDRRRALEQLRDTLARSLDECDPNMHAQLAGQYRQTLAELAALAPATGASVVDQLKAKRAERQAAARKQAAPRKAAAKTK